MPYNLSLPPENSLETPLIFRQLIKAHQALAELKGVAATIPNQAILLSTLTLQEAKDSSAIENIITTHDELYQSDIAQQHFVTLAAKEVHRYAQAVQNGFAEVQRTGLLTVNLICDIQAQIEGNQAGFRRQIGTVLKNEQTGEVVYEPPQHIDEIKDLMLELENFINDESRSALDPLLKMAIIHHQFESIHPFYDGNGRTGRVINILYLVKEGLLSLPILYLSRYINQYKSEYYRLLQVVRDEGAWQDWLLYMLRGVELTARQTIELIQAIKELMQNYKHRIRAELKQVYSQDLLNNLFKHPYTKITFVMEELGVSRPTAANYLKQLCAHGFLEKHQLGRENYYINRPLFELFSNVSQMDM